MRLLTGYAKPVAALAASPDGSRLYSVARGHSTLWAWDIATGEVAHKITCPDTAGGPVRALAVTAEGDYLVCARPDAGVDYRTADGLDGDVLDIHTRVGDAPSLALHPKRRAVAVTLRLDADRHGFQTIDLPDRNHRTFAVATKPLTSLAFAPDGTRIATASADGEVRIHRAASGELLGGFRPAAMPTRLAFNGVNGRLAVACGGRVVVVRGDECETVAEISTGDVRDLAFSPDGAYLAAAADGVVSLWHGSTFAALGRRHLDIGDVACLCWSPDSSHLYAGCDKVIAVCDLADLAGTDRPRPRGGDPLSLLGHKKPPTKLAYSPDGRTLLSCDDTVRAYGWDLSGGAGQAKQAFALDIPSRSGGRSLSWSADARRYTLTIDDIAGVVDVATGDLMGMVPSVSSGQVNYLPTGELFVRRRVGETTVLEIRDPQGVKVIASQSVSWTSALGVDTPTVAVSGPAGSPVYFAEPFVLLSRWDRDTGRVAELFRQPTIMTSVALSPDGRRIVTTGATTAYVWDAECGAEVRRIKHPLTCSGATFTTDGRLVTACYDGVVRFFDGAGGAELFAFALGMGRVYGLAVSPDGMTFAAGVHKRNAVVLMDVPE